MFWNIRDIVLVDYLEKSKLINGEYSELIEQFQPCFKGNTSTLAKK